MTMTRMAIRAVVRAWEDDEGWGVVDSTQTPGGCWTHWSSIASGGYRDLRPGQAVELDWELADQDGYAYRAVRTWPADADPVEPDTTDHDGAFSSSVTIRFDGPH